MSGATLEKVLGQPATLRNVNTVRRLAAKYAPSGTLGTFRHLRHPTYFFRPRLRRPERRQHALLGFASHLACG